MNARRVTIYRDAAGEWRWKSQGHNWRTIGAAEEGFKRKAAVLRKVQKLYPEAEIVVIGEA